MTSNGLKQPSSTGCEGRVRDLKATRAAAMPPDGPQTVLKVLATFNKELDPKKVDLSKTYTNEFVNAALAAK